MIDLALDPSETRARAAAAPHRSGGRPWGRIVLLSVLGLAGTGAFASVASTYLSGLAGPQRAPAAIRQRAADWPDLKDGLPALATGNLPAVASAPKPASDSEPAIARSAALPEPAATPSVAFVAPSALRIGGARPDAVSAPVARPLPALVEVPVIGPTRQAALVPPPRPVRAMTSFPAETVRAKTEATAFAALPPEPAKSEPARSEPAKSKPMSSEPISSEPMRSEAMRPEPNRAKPRIEARARPPAVEKPTAEKPATRKPTAIEARAIPAETGAQDEETEVFGIKVPSLAPAGRKIRESVEALGDAVKAFPDRF